MREKLGGPTLLLGLGLGGLVLHLLQWELLPFLLAAILAFLADPVITRGHRRTPFPRWAVGGLVFLVIFALLLLLGLLAARSAGAGGLQLLQGGPAALEQEFSKVVGPRGVAVFGDVITPQSLLTGLTAAASHGLRPALVLHLLPPAFGVIVGLCLFVIATLYAMITGPSLLAAGQRLLPGELKDRYERLQPAILRILRRYFTGILVIVIVTSALAFLGYGLGFHVKSPFVLALSLGLLETVPVVGPLISAALVLLAGLQLGSLPTLALMIGYALALRLLVDDLLAPIVLGRLLAANPLLVMLSYVVGAVLFGVVGLLLAVPTIAVSRLLIVTQGGRQDPPAETAPPRAEAG